MKRLVPIKMSTDDVDHDLLANEFHGLFRNHHIKKTEKRKKDKPPKSKGLKTLARLAMQDVSSMAPKVQILGNPSPFAVYASMRSHVLEYNFEESCRKLMVNDETDGIPEKQNEISQPLPLPRVVGFGLETVFHLIAESHLKHPHLCTKALEGLLSLLEGQIPQGLKNENQATLDSLFAVLLQLSDCSPIDLQTTKRIFPKSSALTAVATSALPGSLPSVCLPTSVSSSSSSSSVWGRNDEPNPVGNISTSCLISLAVARGDTKQLLQTIVSLIKCDELFVFQQLKNPDILKALQLSIQSILVGRQVLPDWLTHGIPANSAVDVFSVNFDRIPMPDEDYIARSIASDGRFLYILIGRDLFMVGTGTFGTRRGHIYSRQYNFAETMDGARAWIGWANKKLYYYSARLFSQEMSVYDPDKWIKRDTVDLKTNVNNWEDFVETVSEFIKPYSFFTDGDNLGYISYTPNDGFLVRTLPTDCTDIGNYTSELKIRLVKRSIEICGPGTWDTLTEQRQVDTGFDDEVVEITAGKDFTILRTLAGSLLYCGKGASLGQKLGGSKTGKWLELNLTKTTRFTQCAVGHEGIHAILLAEDGTAFFVGTPKRGEDGDLGKARRVAKACKPKKVSRMDGHEVRFVACNNGTSAFVTKSGDLYMFGKDASPPYCDPSGHVTELSGVTVTQIAMGKAHSIILTDEGKVYTMGMNNKGQCGRARPLPREDEGGVDDDDDWDDGGPGGGAASENGEGIPPGDGFCAQGQHHWKHDQCMVCTVCRECTGYGSACISALRPDRNPGQECGCGVGEAGCEDCGSCRACAREGGEDVDLLVIEGQGGVGDFHLPDGYHQVKLNRGEEVDEGNEEVLPDVQLREDRRRIAQLVRLPKEKEKQTQGGADPGPVPFSTLVRLNLTETERIIQIACGLYHTVLLDSYGHVYVFGSNNAGQLGLGDREARFVPERVQFPLGGEYIVQIAAGSNHTVCLDSNGVVYTAGSNSKKQLGESEGRVHENWQAQMVSIDGVGARLGRRVTWIGASGDSTFLTLEASLISPVTLSKSSITANKSAILIIPPPNESHVTTSIIIDRRDGSCHQCLGEKQVDLSRSEVVFDPIFHFLFAYEAATKTVKCFNIVASEIRSPDIPSNLTLSKPPYALPLSAGATLHRWQAGANLLACVDTLVSARVQGLSVNKENDLIIPPTRLKSFTREDYQCVSRFDNNGGGWGYSNNCAEAIRFSCDSDVLLGGYGLYGGRGEYSANIKLFDIGTMGGDWETDGELLTQVDDVVYDTLPRHKFRAMFDEPVRIQAGRWYVAWALISGPSSDCGANGQTAVLTDDHVMFHFKSSKKSTNGTDVNAGQLPQLIYRTLLAEQSSLGIETTDSEPIHILSSDFASVFTPACVNILTSLFNWCKNELVTVVPKRRESKKLAYKFSLLKFVSRTCIRLLEFSTKQAYPLKGGGRGGQMDSVAMAEAIGDVRLMLQNTIMVDIDDPPLLKYSDVHDICRQACNTYIECFGVFYPTSNLKWECLKSATNLVRVKGKGYLRLFMCSIWALWNCRGQLLSIFPVLRNHAHEICGDTSLAFVTNTDGGKMKPNNRLLIAQMTTRFETDNLFSRTGWDFWETLSYILQIVDLAEGRDDEMGKAIILHTSILIGRLMEELVSHACGTFDDLENVIGRMIVSTPCRFARTNQSRTWNTGMGSADAVGFFVDQEGVSIFGACIYIGIGSYTYLLELLQEVDENESPGGSGTGWLTLGSVSGAFDAEDCIGDVAEIRFLRPIHIKAGTKYALRLGNHGGRTCNGDGGVSVLRCADGTTFTFSACPLSFNGTNQIRGQLPYILYFRNPHNSDGRQKSKIVAEMDARKCALKLCTEIFEFSNSRLLSFTAYLDQLLSGKVADDDRGPRDISFHLENPNFITMLLPSVIAHLQKLGASDPRSCVELLELCRPTLRHLSDLNRLAAKVVSPAESKKGDTHGGGHCHYAWIESSHPYKAATLTHYKVSFPSSVKELTVEFDPRCVTAQEEDILRLFIPFENERNQWVDNNEDFEYAPYIPALDKCYGGTNWPEKAVLLPGNEVLFSLETSSDYIRAEKKEYFGFRCLVTGYEQKGLSGYQQAELELSHLGGFCSHELIKRNLVLPPVSAEELKVGDEEKASDELALATCMKHHSLFSKGIGLQYFPTVQEALDGIVPLRENSREREFIADFIARTPNTSGERLANWLQPESFVDPEKCEVIFPKEKLKRGRLGTLTFVTRDQYGDVVVAPSLLVEMKGIPLRSSHHQQQNSRQTSRVTSRTRNYNLPGFMPGITSIPDTPFEATVKDKMRYQSITMMKEYENYSFEELRLLSPSSKRTSESMLIRENSDGTYTASWCPLFVGFYHISVTVDGYAVPQISAVEVEEGPDSGPPSGFSVRSEDQSKTLPSRITYSNKRKFKARADDSSGLRIRDHPTLQSEQLGLIPLNGIVTFVHEIHNDDGIWVKLDDPSFRDYCKNANAFQREGWCLQFNQHLGKTFLFPLEPPKPLPGVQSDSTIRKSTESPSSTNTDNSNSAKALRLNGGLGHYVVVQTGASAHNIRPRPSLRAPAVAILPVGTKFEAVDECYNGDGLWLKVDRNTEKRYRSKGEGESWALAVGRVGDAVYLRKWDRKTGEGQPGFDFSEASRIPKNVFHTSMPPPLSFGGIEGQQDVKEGKSEHGGAIIGEEAQNLHIMKNTQLPGPVKANDEKLLGMSRGEECPKPANSSDASEESPSKGSGRSRSSSTFGALQKWLQMSTESLGGGSHGQSGSSASPGGKSSQSMLQASKSFVKDGISALSSSGKQSQTVAVVTNSATQTSPDPEPQPRPPPPPPLDFPKGFQFNIGTSLEFPLTKGSGYEPQKSKPNEKRKSRSQTRGSGRERKPSKSPRPNVDESGQTTVKEAIAPGDAQSVRAVFGAVMWYAAIIHDAMASASYLKFTQSSPTTHVADKASLEERKVASMTNAAPWSTSPRKPARFIVESSSTDVVLRRRFSGGTDRTVSQRHSVEASSSPWLLNTNPTMASEELEFLSQMLPNGGGMRETLELPKFKEGVQASPSPSNEDGAYMNEGKRPPAAMGALQKIWAHIKKNCNEALLQELFRGLRYKLDGAIKSGAVKSKRDRKGGRGVFQLEVDASHKNRKEKPKEIQAMGRSFLMDDEEEVGEAEFSIPDQCEVCQVRFSRRGKSRKTHFGFSTLCDNCVDSQLKVKRQQSGAQDGGGCRGADEFLHPALPSTNIHASILNNALFLLQLINTSPEGFCVGAAKENRSVFPIGDTFCSYEALGVTTSQLEGKEDFTGSKPDLTSIETEDFTPEDKMMLGNLLTPFPPPPKEEPQIRRRKTSNGDPSIVLDDDLGENLLSRPSAALQKFLDNTLEHGEKEALAKLCGNVISFVSEKHDLVSLKLFLFQTIRKITCRCYGMQSLAWLLRNVSQPAALHDLFWWYASTIERKSDQPDVKQEDVDDGWWQIRSHPLADSPSTLFPILSESFYVLLQTMSDIMKFLPIGSPLLEMAVKCWGVSFSRKDHRFLHKCKIFRNLSKIMSQFDGETEWSKSSVSVDCHDGETENSVELTTCFVDLIPHAEVKVSSRIALCSSLTDDSTETFWESGDDDSRTKHILITIQTEATVRVAAIYLDNVKDNLYKVTSICTKVGTRAEDTSIFGAVDVDPKFVGWIWFPMKDPSIQVVRFDLKGADSNIRVRQVKILGSFGEQSEVNERSVTSLSIARQKCERETLRIFRCLSSEVFGKLLSERKQGEDDEGNDLQEHVVGILFSRNKLSYLQKQVCSHIVAAIHRETVKIKEEFSANMVGSLLEVADESLVPGGERSKFGDRYCFEMLSLVLALAGSKVGRSYLSRQNNLIQDLVQLLHAGTPRIQRQVLQVIRKILPEISPLDFAVITGNQTHPNSERKLVSLDLFLGIICKALQLKARTTGSNGRSRLARTISLGDTLSRDDFPPAYWFLHGEVEPTLAMSVVRLIKDMTDGVFSTSWQFVSRETIAEIIQYIPTIPVEKRTLEACLCSPEFWIAVATLCVLHEDHAALLSYPAYKNGATGRPTCINHDDGDTVAVIQCAECGNLCADCDRILHLPKKTWSHLRKICKEEEESINVDLHEGCGRIKLFWLMALADSSTLKALVEFRQGIPKVNERDVSPLQAVGLCRFCGISGNTGPLALGSVCGDPECQEFAKSACDKILPCSHLCGGVKGEQNCLPCLQQCAGYHSDKLRQDGEDMCMICFTDALSYAPALQLDCGHVYHYHCCLAVLQKRWAGPRITFTFSTCPVCKVDMTHELLEHLLTPIHELLEDVKRKALMRLEYEGMSQIDAIASPGGQYYRNPGQFAMDRYAYYLCFKCKKAYFGGDARCDVEIQPHFDPEELICGGCSDISQAQLCPKHGTDYLEYKCRYCCSVAVFFCFGTTHFCNGCHDDFQRVTSIPKQDLPRCPAGPRTKQLDVEECPLHVTHPPTGEEFALGCGICRNAHTF